MARYERTTTLGDGSNMNVLSAVKIFRCAGQWGEDGTHQL